MPDTTSLVVIQKRIPDLKITIEENERGIFLGSGILKIFLVKEDGHVEYFFKDSTAVLKETGEPIFSPVQPNVEKAFSIKQRYELSSDEGIYGLGQHQYGIMNYRGRTVKLVQTNTDAVTPFLISTKNYGIYWITTPKPFLTTIPGRVPPFGRTWPALSIIISSRAVPWTR